MAKDTSSTSETTDTLVDAAGDNAEPSLSDLQTILNGSASTELDGSSDEELADEEEGSAENHVGEKDESSQAEEADETAEPEGEAETADDAESEEESDDDQAGEEDGAAEDPEADEEVDKIRATFTPAQQKLFDKALRKKADRIIRLRTESERKDAELTELRGELDKVKSSTPAPIVAASAENPLAGIDDENALDQRQKGLWQLRKWALKNPKGGTIGEGDSAVEMSEERVAEIIADTEEALQVHVPRRREFLRLRRDYERQAEQIHPWLKEPRSDGSKQVDYVLKQYPQLKEMFPNARLIVADLIVINKARAQKAAGTAAKPEGKKPIATAKAPAMPRGQRPPKVSGVRKASQSAARRVEETGEDPDASALRSIIG